MEIDTSAVGIGVSSLLGIAVAAHQYLLKYRGQSANSDALNSQAMANEGLYKVLSDQLHELREEIKELKQCNKLLERKNILLEKLAIHVGIDIEAAYAEIDHEH